MFPVFIGYFSQAGLLQTPAETIFGSLYDFTKCQSSVDSCLKDSQSSEQCRAESTIGIICQGMSKKQEAAKLINCKSQKEVQKESRVSLGTLDSVAVTMTTKAEWRCV